MKFTSYTSTLLISAISIVSQVQAHMRMNEPPGLRSKEENVNPRGDDDHFPLHADGSDFPCQNSHRDPGHNPIRNYTAGTSVPVQYSPTPEPLVSCRVRFLCCVLGGVLIVGLCLGRWSRLGRLMGVVVVSFLCRMIMGLRSMLFIRSRVVVPWMR